MPELSGQQNQGVGAGIAGNLQHLLLSVRTRMFLLLPVWLLFSGSASAALPSIASFSASRSAIVSGQTAFLAWSVSGADVVTIDNGIGDVTLNTSYGVTPASTTRYTLTASNTNGSVSATTQVDFIGLKQLSPTTYHTENVFFIIADPSLVDFPKWSSVYANANVDDYVAQLKAAFPNDYMMVVVAANQLTPATVPSVITQRHLANGIGQNSINGVAVPNICRYHLGTSSTLSTGAFAVLDHEIGHNWGVQIGAELGVGHWLKEGTVHGQMADNFFNTDFTTAQQIIGDPVNGFSWANLDNLARNETDVFTDQDLYAMGLNPTFPDAYVLSNPVLNPDYTVSYSAVAKYDHAWVVNRNGPRLPSYVNSEKQFRLGFVYVARDLAEIQSAYGPIEQSARHFANADKVDPIRYRFQVPFLAATRLRASVKSQLADLDGNTAPVLSLTGSNYLTSSTGAATIAFIAVDPDGPLPTVSLLPDDQNAVFANGTVRLTGLDNGVHFYTLKAEDSYGKRAYTHFVIEVARQPGIINLVEVRSRKTHGVAGNFDVNIDSSIPLTGAISIEPRSGANTIIFRFDGPVTFPGILTATDAEGVDIVGSQSVAAGNDVTVTLPAFADPRRVALTLTDVNNLGVVASASIGFLIGDVNNSLSVNASDIAGVKARSGQVTNASNFMFDLNVSGTINASDISTVKARSGMVLP
ncbi:MAG: dockerin type I domain-containing protein [Betaproteobacteria bacterium]